MCLHLKHKQSRLHAGLPNTCHVFVGERPEIETHLLQEMQEA
jgi:hypothetical protein